MNFIRRLSLFLIVVLAALPLVILAQDNNQPVPATPPPKPTIDYDSLHLTVVPTVDVQPAQSMIPPTLELMEYPTDDGIHPATPRTPDPGELFEYPVDVCSLDPSGDPTIELKQILCPPTKTPTPTYVPITVTPSAGIVNGLWVLDPNGSGFKTSGQCQIQGGDNGGMGGEYQPDDLPKIPVCMTGDRQWLKVDASGPYPLVVPSFYSESEMSREILVSNGETTGSVSVNISRQYHVISPSEIEYSYTRQEKGGCTTTSTVRYKLVEANDLVCSGAVMTPDFTAVPTQMPTAKAGETQVPMPTAEPPIRIGEYTIQLPPVDASCSVDKLPKSNQVDVSYDNDQNMFIDFGGSGFTLFWNGRDYYQYSKGNQFMVSVNTYPGGASLSWSSQGCFMNSQLTREDGGNAFPATATLAAGEPTLIPMPDISASAGSVFTVATTDADVMCAAENRAMLPDLTDATLTAQDDGSFKFSVGGEDYTLENLGGAIVYTKVDDAGNLFSVSLSGFTDGIGNGVIMALEGDKSCMIQLTFNPQ